MQAQLEINNYCWESPTRYYEVRYFRKPNGQWLLVKAWGGKKNKLGGEDIEKFNALEDLLNRLDELDKRRCRRGYKRILN